MNACVFEDIRTHIVTNHDNPVKRLRKELERLRKNISCLYYCISKC